MVAVSRVDTQLIFECRGVLCLSDSLISGWLTPSLTLAAIMGEGSVLVMVAASASPLHVNGQTSKD